MRAVPGSKGPSHKASASATSDIVATVASHEHICSRSSSPVALNLLRTLAWLHDVPRAPTRISRFAALAV